MVIGLAGKKGAGKDTIARQLRLWLEEYGFKVATVAFTDPLKELVLKCFCPCDWSRADLESQKETILDHVQGMPTVRYLLQRVGTDIRGIDDLAFRWAMARRLGELRGTCDYVLVTDVRFPGEAAIIRRLYDVSLDQMCGVVIGLTRAPQGAEDTHASETALDGYAAFDAVIDNADMGLMVQTAEAQRLCLVNGWVTLPELMPRAIR